MTEGPGQCPGPSEQWRAYWTISLAFIPNATCGVQ